MGSCGSKLESEITGQTSKDIQFIRSNLQLADNHLRILLRAFKKINIHQDGVVTFDEFCARIRCEPSFFLGSIFSFFSSSDSKCSKLRVGLNFAEFVLFCIFFLTLDDHGFTEYLFFLLTDGDFNQYLKNKDDSFSIEQFKENIHHTFGGSWGNDEQKRSVVAWVFDNTKDKLGGDGAVQIDMREKIVNKAFWKQFRGMGNTLLLKRDIKAIRNKLHRLQGRTQYHDSVDHHHHTHTTNHPPLSHTEGDQERRPSKHSHLPGHHTQRNTAADMEDLEEVREKYFPDDVEAEESDDDIQASLLKYIDELQEVAEKLIAYPCLQGRMLLFRIDHIFRTTPPRLSHALFGPFEELKRQLT
eukprot:gene36355-44101_t